MKADARAAMIDGLLRTPSEAVAVDSVPVSGGTQPSAQDARTAHALLVHRQTVRHALIGAIRDAFPALELALGEDYIAALAGEFIATHPPRSPVLHEYGDALPAFVATFPPLQGWPWLADLARVDWARREAYHAADAAPLRDAQWHALDPETLLSARFELHPSLRLLTSDYPQASLWFLHQPADADTAGEALVETIDWQPECCQIWRIDERVLVKRIDANTQRLLRGLSDGRSLLVALWSAFDEAIDHSRIADVLRQLIDDRLIVAMHASETHAAETHTPETHVPAAR